MKNKGISNMKNRYFIPASFIKYDIKFFIFKENNQVGRAITNSGLGGWECHLVSVIDGVNRGYWKEIPEKEAVLV